MISSWSTPRVSFFWKKNQAAETATGSGRQKKAAKSKVPMSSLWEKKPRTKNQTGNIELKVSKPNFSVYYSVSILRNQIYFSKLVLYLRELNLSKYADFEFSYIINSIILVYYIFYIWYSTHIILWTCICMYLALLFSIKSFPNYVKVSFRTCFYMFMWTI
jgi:hypothetical protein